MTTANLDQQIFDLSAAAYKVDASALTRETTFAECGKESMKMIALLASIENKLDVEVPLREGMLFKTLGELIDRVAQDL